MLTPSQFGRLMENLAENAWTAGSDGRLVSYLPVLDSHGVDRAVALGGGPPLFIQVKAHQRARPGDRLAFEIPLTAIEDHPRWLALLLEGSPKGIREAYLVPGPDLLRLGERGTLVDGRPCLHATLSPTSPTWSTYLVDPANLGARLETLASPPALAPPPPLERSQEEGGFFEESVVAALLAGGPSLAPYRPAVDLGRDLLVQRTGSPEAVYLQIKGTEREDRPGLARFQVRRRSFARDPALFFLFCFSRQGAIDPVWLVPSADLEDRASQRDPDHLSFEAHVTGPDERWSPYRLPLAELATALSSAPGGRSPTKPGGGAVKP